MKIGLIIFISFFVLQLIVASVLLIAHHGPEVYEYEEIAINLLTNHTFMCHRLGAECYSLVPPLYPMLTAVVYLLFNYSHLAMLLVQMLLMSLVCVFACKIAKEVFDKYAGIICAVLCIFHPGLIIYSVTKLHEFSLVACLFTALLLIILKFNENMTYKNIFIISLFMGLSILTRASIVLFIPLFLIWLYLYRKDVFKSTKEYLLKSFFIIFTIALILSPWIARNYHIQHKLIFMQFPSVDLWVGNNINATGGNYLNDGRMVLKSMPKDFVDSIYKANESNKDMIFEDAAYKFIKSHPYKFISLFFKKMYYFWWFSPQIGIKYSYLALICYKIWYSTALFFAIWGVIFVLAGKDYKLKKKAYLLLLFFLAISVMQSLFYVEGRHRLSIEPILLIFSANGIFSIGKYYLSHK